MSAGVFIAGLLAGVTSFGQAAQPQVEPRQIMLVNGS